MKIPFSPDHGEINLDMMNNNVVLLVILHDAILKHIRSHLQEDVSKRVTADCEVLFTINKLNRSNTLKLGSAQPSHNDLC